MTKKELNEYLKREVTGDPNSSWFAFVKGLFKVVTKDKVTTFDKAKMAALFVVVGAFFCAVSLLFLPLRLVYSLAAVASDAVDRAFPRG